MNPTTSILSLPEDCVSTILSHTSPQDVCRFSLVSTTFVSVSNSNLVWKTFLPSDYQDIVSRAVNQFSLKFISSYKQLFRFLCRPLLIDGGNKVVIINLKHFLILLLCFWLFYSVLFLCDVMNIEFHVGKIFGEKIVYVISKRIVNSMEHRSNVLELEIST
jgi:hypothetical protein